MWTFVSISAPLKEVRLFPPHLSSSSTKSCCRVSLRGCESSLRRPEGITQEEKPRSPPFITSASSHIFFLPRFVSPPLPPVSSHLIPLSVSACSTSRLSSSSLLKNRLPRWLFSSPPYVSLSIHRQIVMLTFNVLVSLRHLCSPDALSFLLISIFPLSCPPSSSRLLSLPTATTPHQQLPS